MPSRILREGITDSEAINSLTAEQERLFIRLVVAVDDFGRLDARPAVVRARCFPVLEFPLERIAEWIAALGTTKPEPLLDLYVVDGKVFLQLRRVPLPRADKSKCPKPIGFCLAPTVHDIMEPSLARNRIQAFAEEDGRVRPCTPVPYSLSESNAKSGIDLSSGKAPPDPPAPKVVPEAKNQTGLPGIEAPPRTPPPDKEAAITRILTHWRERSGMTGAAIEGPKAKKRRGRISARLAEKFTVNELKLVADGMVKDPFLMGTDPNSKKGGFRDVKTVYRDDEQCGRLIALATSTQPARGPPSPASHVEFVPDLPDDDGMTPEQRREQIRDNRPSFLSAPAESDDAEDADE